MGLSDNADTVRTPFGKRSDKEQLAYLKTMTRVIVLPKLDEFLSVLDLLSEFPSSELTKEEEGKIREVRDLFNRIVNTKVEPGA